MIILYQNMKRSITISGRDYELTRMFHPDHSPWPFETDTRTSIYNIYTFSAQFKENTTLHNNKDQAVYDV
jgi:hypothetical protein